MSSYLYQNRSTPLSKVIFSVRSQTLDIKSWNIWKNTDNSCVGCELNAETITHFMKCNAYRKESEEMNWQEILGNDIENNLK